MVSASRSPSSLPSPTQASGRRSPEHAHSSQRHRYRCRGAGVRDGRRRGRARRTGMRSRRPRRQPAPSGDPTVLTLRITDADRAFERRGDHARAGGVRIIAKPSGSPSRQRRCGAMSRLFDRDRKPSPMARKPSSSPVSPDSPKGGQLSDSWRRSAAHPRPSRGRNRPPPIYALGAAGRVGWSTRCCFRRPSQGRGSSDLRTPRSGPRRGSTWSAAAGWGDPRARARPAKSPGSPGLFSGPWRTRTSNLGIKSPLLYQLS